MRFSLNVNAVVDEAARLRRFAGNLDKVKDRTIGTLLRRLPVAARRDIQDEYNLPAQRINAGLSARRAGDAVELTGSKRGIGLTAYGARFNRRTGVTVTMLKSQGPERWPDAFIGVGRSGNAQVFMRVGKARLPIKTVYGSSIATMLRKADRAERLVAIAQQVVSDEADRLTKEK